MNGMSAFTVLKFQMVKKQALRKNISAMGGRHLLKRILCMV